MFDLLHGERFSGCLEGGDEILAENVAARCIVGDLLDGFLGVVWVTHESEVLPDDFFAGTLVEAGKVGVERAPALDARGVFVAEGDSCATERVRDDDFGLGADAHARARVKFGSVDFEGLARIGMMQPCGDKVFVRFVHGRNKDAAARMQFGVGCVKRSWSVIGKKPVDGRDLLFEGVRRVPVVVALGNRLRLANFLARKVGAVGRIA